MASSRVLGWARGGGSEPSGYRFSRQRCAAKLIALALFWSVRSSIGRRRLPPVSVVPTATASYAAQASYMHVCAIARARATIGGPLRNDRLKRTSARAVAFQSLTTVAREEVAHSRIVASVARAIMRGNRTGPSNRAWDRYGPGYPARYARAIGLWSSAICRRLRRLAVGCARTA